jgi:hypothetical protein
MIDGCAKEGKLLLERAGSCDALRQAAACSHRLAEKAAEKQNAENHYDSDYDDLDQAHN